MLISCSSVTGSSMVSSSNTWHPEQGDITDKTNSSYVPGLHAASKHMDLV